ncbi:CotH kinase family protein [Mycolicibacterium neoaurum]|uniref:CotH kinase family protein n=1 Tax=Mycolicibacterium neoaurum TaxID=1795 RepID=UPI002672D6F3|nr:CotH kinase family protein [Mycolicibacterium neoaurum]MDO3398618.1 CotH kinase family protein [Mycolicibacterium neoaurum]
MPDEHSAAPPARFAHRIPTRLRQYWKLLALFVTAMVAMVILFGPNRVHPYITGDTGILSAEITDNITGTVDLFDADVPHSLTIELSPAEYNDMITAYEKDGAKKWVTADITIDETPISDVAVRLKGNSTLMGLRPADARPGGVPPAAGGPAQPAADNGAQPAADAGAMAALAVASADDPTTLPLLISFDRNADGHGYQGLTELSVRPGTPVLNEALALSLTAQTGQPTQRYAYATYTINGETTTRLLLEHPDDTYANTLFGSDGYLYKADANSRLEYRGTDQSEYADQFKAINSVDNGNLAPIINFLRWLDRADDTEFDEHLADWVDVDSLARYLATQNLLANADDMGGPGQNYYLWYSLDTKKITVVSWDLNLAMQGDAGVGPTDEVQIGPPPAQMAAMFADMMPPGGQGGGPQFGNPLKTRFLESDAMAETYLAAYWDLYDQMYGGGQAHALLDDIAASVPVTDGLSQDELNTATASMRQWLDERTAALQALREG